MFIVGLMVTALTLNPAIACHFCGGGWNGGGYYGYYPAYDSYSSGCGDCGGCEVVVDDCGGCGGCDSCGGCDACGVEVKDGESDAAPEAAPQAPPETRADERPQLPATQPEQPATVDRPVDAAPLTPMAPPQEAPVTPPAETTPPADDLFNGSEATPAAETPAATEPAIEPAATEPAATEPADDLFGTPETPAETPAETPTTDPAAPAETPAADESSDDLFGGTEESATETPAATDSAPAETPAADEAPAEGAAPEDGKAEGSDDIFGARNVLREAGGLASNEMRMWVDNTGHYAVNARLIRFVDNSVQLMKHNGRTTTVSLNRLSERDLQFVNRQASAQKSATTQTAQVTISPAFAN
jgi:hypothetical protein